MTLVALRRIPQTANEWDAFHWSHYVDHRIILKVVSQKAGQHFLMPPIWPIIGNTYPPRVSYFHQQLHIQMNALSGAQSSDMLNVDLSTEEGIRAFFDPNFRDHLQFHNSPGIPVA